MARLPAKRRGHGEGNFRQTPFGKWEGSTWVSEVGKRVYATGETEKKAREALHNKVKLVSEGKLQARAAPTTFEAYAQRMIAEREGIGQRTRDKYLTELRLYLIPLHHIRLDKITPAMLRGVYAEMRSRGLSDSVRGHAHTLTRLVLETAKNDGLIARNVAVAPGVRPKSERGAEAKSMPAYTREQARRIIQAARSVTHGEVIAFLLLTGMRKGEVAGLRWESVDMERGTLQVKVTRSVSGSTVYEGTPKTNQSRREVPLSDSARALLSSTLQLNLERHAAYYPDQPASPYVFPSVTGTPLNPDNLRRTLHQVLDLADQQGVLLPRLAVHALRHSFVSLAAASGQRLEKIARIIGDSPETVMKVYLHVFKEDVTAPSLDIGDFTSNE